MRSPSPHPLAEVYAPFNVRDDLVAAHLQVWEKLAQPGTWLTGAERVAVAAETRAAVSCALCRERKAALSPYAVQGAHETASDLGPARVDAVHRVITDPARLSKRLVDDFVAAGDDDAVYVELLGVALSTLAIDTFHRAVGIPLLALPTPKDGDPRRERPAPIEDMGAWVPVLSLKSPIARELYRRAIRASNVGRAMSLVPDQVRDQITLLEVQYVPISVLASTKDVVGREIGRTQIELIASRVSALNACFY